VQISDDGSLDSRDTQSSTFSDRFSPECADLRVPYVQPLALPEQVFRANPSITQDQAENLEQCTRGQATSKLWHEERTRRITSSKFGLVCKKMKLLQKYPDRSVSDSFYKNIYSQRCFKSKATDYGIDNEINALNEYKTMSSNHIHTCGLIVNPVIPFLAATPDALVCDNGEAGCVEVKCPLSCKDLTPVEATSVQSNFYLELCPITGALALKRDHNYYYQVQGQLLVSGLPFCGFYYIYAERNKH